ncbi:hypothetical protein [Duncaniella muris]|uniref:Uncharacterized protein n=1 Tax=Duncaniella muris TaxID=2094150 RepID=A0A2V1IMB4_9BACT|nr:hypothetical protein [Duncaniella muris]PWB00311.1 hypothetical protein C5O23_13295 [Duncaniella muris]
MTYVSNIFNSSLNSNRSLKYYSVEVITFDGDSYTEEVEARSADEAQEIAASMYDDVDYTMVQGCFAY